MTVLSDAPARKPVRWVLKPQENGTVEVWQGRKKVAETDSLEFATRFVQDRLVEGDRVVTEDPDGYLRKTRVKRRRWRAGRG